MSPALYILIGVLIGGVAAAAVTWIVAQRSAEARRSKLAEEAAAAGAALTEVRGRLAAAERDLDASRRDLQAQRIAQADSQARLEAAREHFAEQRKQIEQMETKLKETFASLSAAALKSNNEQFITLAEAKMKPLREQLGRYEQGIKELEKVRAEAYGGLSKHLESLETRSERLGKETGQLVAALRQSGAKGKWGEVTLQRVVELAGMNEHCDFETQATQAGGQRPDLIVHLPGRRMLAVDSKVNTAAYLDAASAKDDAERDRFLAKYAADVRNTLKSLSAKEYWRQLSPAPEFVVMFMPGEAFFAAALSQDRDLLTDGVDKGVLLASPTTLIALLLAVRHGWQQQQVAENAEKIAAAGRDLYDRLCTFVAHLDDIRAGIEKAADAYNKAVGNWESRTMPGVRKLKELGADTGKDAEALTAIDIPLRSISTHDDGPAAVKRHSA